MLLLSHVRFRQKYFRIFFGFCWDGKWKSTINNGKTRPKPKNKKKFHSFLSLPISFLCAVTTITIAISSSIQSSPPHHYHSRHFLLPPQLLSPPRPLPSLCLHEALSVQVSWQYFKNHSPSNNQKYVNNSFFWKMFSCVCRKEREKKKKKNTATL